MKGKRPWGRIIASTIALAILALGVCLLSASRQMRRRVDAARVAEPIRMQVDLSKPGEFVGEFVHTFVNAHYEKVRIETDPPFATPEQAQASIEGLQAQVTFATPEGDVVSERELSADSCSWSWVKDGEAVPAFGFHGLQTGTYQLKLTIERGAPALADIPQTLVARYGLCGLEYAPPEITRWMSVACFIIAGTIALTIVSAAIGKRRSRQGAESGTNAHA